MSQTFASITTASDSVKVGIVNLDDRTDSLRSAFSGTSAPGSPVEGQLWLDTVNKILFLWADLGSGAAWHEVATDFMQANMDFNDNQLLNARAENEATVPTPAAGNVGKLVLYTGGATNRLTVVRDSSVAAYVMEGYASEYVAIDVPVKSWDFDATNPPTLVTVGTTPTIRGYEFNATNEQMSVAVPVPAGMATANDVKVRFFALLSAAETANDTIDATLNSIALLTDGTELATATSVSDAVAYDIAANNSQYSLHKFDFTLAYNDATVPIVPGDMLFTEFALSSVASVAGIIVVHTQFLFPFGTTILET